MSLASPVALRRSRQDADAPFFFHHVEVVALRRLSPGFLRVTLAGPELHRAADARFDQRIKIVLPLPATDGRRGDLEDFDLCDDWYTAWRALPTERRHPVRTYTLRAVRPEDREIDVDIALHGPHGIVGAWAHDARLGDELVVLAPQRGQVESLGPLRGVDFDPPAGTRAVLLCGDATAVPAIATTLEQLADDVRCTVVLQLAQVDDAAVLPSRPGLDLRATIGDARAVVAEVRRAAADMSRDEGLGRRSIARADVEDIDVDTTLLWEVPRASADAPAPADGPYAWIAGEAGMVRDVRRLLVGDLAWPRTSVAFMGYWRAGRAESA